MKSARKATKLLVFSDTHVRRLEQLNPVVKESLGESDWVVHCGDYTGLDLVKELRDMVPRFVGVYGNSDPDSVRSLLTRQQIFTIDGWRIGAVRPYWGAEPDGIEERGRSRYGTSGCNPFTAIPMSGWNAIWKTRFWSIRARATPSS